MRRHHEAFAANTWDQQAMEPEARVCLILNRFTRNLTVMYASSASEKVFHVDPDQLTGKPILLYIRADDLAPFVEQVDHIKATTVITQMRFWFQSPNWPQEIPCESIIFGAADGVVAVVRRCKPFVRTHLIDAGEQFGVDSRGSSWSSGWNRSYGSSPVSTFSATPPAYRDSVSRATLNQIRIIDFDGDERVPPLTHLSEDPSHTEHESAAADVPAFKEVITQYYREDWSEEDEDEGAAGRFKQMAINERQDDLTVLH